MILFFASIDTYLLTSRCKIEIVSIFKEICFLKITMLFDIYIENIPGENIVENINLTKFEYLEPSYSTNNTQ